MEGFYVALFVWNVIVFALVGIDKYKAIRGKWRISERTFLICAFLMGAAGVFCGMQIFRHKTQKDGFRTVIEIALAVNAAAVVLIERI
ncbi:MAG: DUF1294 domain-containing protein [Clostridia bacterium]|nr:DUF1294 domain-containing protein [Clostridia bacterium]